MTDAQSWPQLSAERDGATIATLHLFSQVVGKVPTALVPWRNHSWHLTLHSTPRGLATELIHHENGPFTLTLDLVGHELVFESRRERRTLSIGPGSVAAFHADLMAMLAQAGFPARTHDAPNEIDPAIPFAEDKAHRPYDRDSAERLLGALLSVDRVFRLFRSGFLGKASPVHFFWGSFDLAATRFSGRPAPLHPGGIPHLPDAVTRESYSHEEASVGFWPGGAMPGGPFFYAYAYPEPAGFAAARIEPEAARYDQGYGEFVLDYDAVRSAAAPDETLLAFLESSYVAAADLGNWDRAALECPLGRPRVPREV